jgi:hypothetical protein
MTVGRGPIAIATGDERGHPDRDGGQLRGPRVVSADRLQRKPDRDQACRVDWRHPSRKRTGRVIGDEELIDPEIGAGEIFERGQGADQHGERCEGLSVRCHTLRIEVRQTRPMPSRMKASKLFAFMEAKPGARVVMLVTPSAHPSHRTRAPMTATSARHAEICLRRAAPLPSDTRYTR